MEERTEEVLESTNRLEAIAAMRQCIGSVIAGQQQMVDLLLTAILTGGHVLIEGVPGVAKTLTARLISKLIKADFSRVQFTSDLMPSDLLGTNVFNMGTHAFEFHKGPVFADIVLTDEINRAPAKTQSALFEVMEEKQVTIDGVRYPMSDLYTIIATQNPIEQEGTYRLPEAQLDRFLFKIEVGYPNAEEELRILQSHNSDSAFTKLENIRPLTDIGQMLELRRKAAQVFIDEKMMQYIIRLIQQTRTHGQLYLGASPRASIALLQASKAYAILQGRDFVIADDIKLLAKPILCHRIQLTAEAEMEGVTIENVIREIVEKTENIC
ncbi:MAG: MoxR family ATPase [Paludibacteraceae bacterium]|nr:MoxR family ATPase [Paludibacteraceae bacterium]